MIWKLEPVLTVLSIQLDPNVNVVSQGILVMLQENQNAPVDKCTYVICVVICSG